MLQLLPKSIWLGRQELVDGDDSMQLGKGMEVTDTRLASTVLPTDKNEARVLAELSWQPTSFMATFDRSTDADRVINFPSPVSRENTCWDLATLDWHFARDRSGNVVSGPGVIVLDILQGGNKVARYIAKVLSKNGIHGFVLHLPQTGRRVMPGAQHDWSAFLPDLRQGAADARRARDIVAMLPTLTGGVGIQGTSLGGFVATMAASIDGVFDSVVLALTGGDVYSILSHGKMDAAKVRSRLRAVGYSDEKLRQDLDQVEPLHVAHRLHPEKTWLFTARHDQVVPRIYSERLSHAIGLDSSHRRQLSGCHYTCVINAHRFLSETVRAVQLSELRRLQAAAALQAAPFKRIA